MFSFIPSEPKRKTPSTSGGVSGEPTRKKKRPSSPKEILVTRDEALLGIRKDWTIIKNKRLKDKPYQVYLQDRTFVKKIIGMSYTTLKWLPQFKDDKELVHDAVLAGEEIEDEVPIHPSAIQFASDRLKNDVEFIKELRVFMKGESNAISLLAKFDSLIPDSVLVQIEPISKYFLDRSIEGGKYELFLQQKSILPKQRQSYLKRIIQITNHRTITGDGTYKMYIGPKYLAQYEKIFSKLIEDDYGKRSLIRVISASSHWSDKFIKWMTSVISDELYLKLVQKLRLTSNFSKLLIQEFISEIRKDAFYTSFQEPSASSSFKEHQKTVRQQLKTNYTGKNDLMNRMLHIMELSSNGQDLLSEIVHVFNFVSQFGTAIHLDFSESSASASRDNDASKADNIIYIVFLLLVGRPHFNAVIAMRLIRRCIADGYVKSTHLLLETFAQQFQSVSVDWTTFLFSAIESGNLAMVKLLHKNVSLSVKHGRDDDTTLIAASNNLKITRYILVVGDRGYDPNIGIVNAVNSRGYTALARAVAHNNVKVVRLLLQHSADANIANIHGRTPLFKATTNDVKIFRDLLNPIHGVDVNHRDQNGNSVLHHLSGVEHWDSSIELKFKMLLARGVDVNIKNNNGLTPLFFCRLTEVYNMFTSNGGGGIVSLNRFRSKINVSALTSNVILKKQEDMMVEMSDHTNMPVRCLPCKHVFNGHFLFRWVNENKYGYEGTSNFKDSCPNCRKKIDRVEFMSKVVAANWDENEGKAVTEENSKKSKMDSIKHKPIYRQMVINFNQKKREYEEAKEKKEEEEDRVRNLKRGIGDAVDAAARHYRDLRLVEKIRELKL